MWLANTLTLSRIPLGIMFLVFAEQTYLASAILVAGAVTDIADGIVARKWIAPGSTAAVLGAWLDPTCDKFFIGCVLSGIYLHSAVDPFWIPLVLMREALQLIALSVMAAGWLRPTATRADYDFRADRLGKSTTVVQFAFATAALFRFPAAILAGLAGLAAVLGAASVWIYIRRYLSE